MVRSSGFEVHLRRIIMVAGAGMTAVAVSSCREGRGRDTTATTPPRDLAESCRADSLVPLLRAGARQMHQRNRVPGLSAALYIPSRNQLVTAVDGVSSLEGRRTLQASDRFLAGSVGKTFFAALALRAASRGQLDLDVPLDRQMPDRGLPSFAWITPRMLLTHRSGIGEYDGLFMEALLAHPLRARERDDWLDVVRRTPPQRTEAGTFRYSDLNYVVLGLLLDAVVPGGAYDAIDRELLRPLQLTGTAPSISPVIAGLVDGYDGASGMFGRDAMRANGALIYNPQFEFGGGGFASTPTDLARWMAAFRLGRAFPAERWPEVVARPAGIPDTAQDWRGIGVHVGRGRLGSHVEHSGYMPGYVSWVRWYDSLGISLALQVNASDTVRLVDDGFAWLDTVATRIGDRCRVSATR